jgi:hypothetical protein
MRSCIRDCIIRSFPPPNHDRSGAVGGGGAHSVDGAVAVMVAARGAKYISASSPKESPSESVATCDAGEFRAVQTVG